MLFAHAAQQRLLRRKMVVCGILVLMKASHSNWQEARLMLDYRRLLAQGPIISQQFHHDDHHHHHQDEAVEASSSSLALSSLSMALPQGPMIMWRAAKVVVFGLAVVIISGMDCHLLLALTIWLRPATLKKLRSGIMTSLMKLLRLPQAIQKSGSL